MCRAIQSTIGHRIVVGVHRFYAVGEDFPRDAVIGAIVTGRWWWLAVLRYYAQTIPKRLLATAYVWGLADYPRGEEQTWRDVHVLRWILKQKDKLTK